MKLAVLLIFAMSLLSFNSFAQTCDYKIEILADGDEFESEEFKWRMRAVKIEGKSTNITGTAEIEANGKTVKSYKPWTSESIAKQKTSNEYSPNLKPGSYEITAEISVDCDDTSKDNNVDKKEIKIKGEIEETKSSRSKNDGTETKKRNEEKLSTNSNAENTITAKAKKSITNEEADNTIELKSQNSRKIRETQPITSNTIQNPQNPEMVYASSNERAKGWIMIFLLTLSILLNIVLIWRR